MIQEISLTPSNVADAYGCNIKLSWCLHAWVFACLSYQLSLLIFLFDWIATNWLINHATSIWTNQSRERRPGFQRPLLTKGGILWPLPHSGGEYRFGFLPEGKLADATPRDLHTGKKNWPQKTGQLLEWNPPITNSADLWTLEIFPWSLSWMLQVTPYCKLYCWPLVAEGRIPARVSSYLFSALKAWPILRMALTPGGNCPIEIQGNMGPLAEHCPGKPCRIIDICTCIDTMYICLYLYKSCRTKVCL